MGSNKDVLNVFRLGWGSLARKKMLAAEDGEMEALFNACTLTLIFVAPLTDFSNELDMLKLTIGDRIRSNCN